MARGAQESDPRTLPEGTLTFLFSDIEGSTRLVQDLGPAFTPLLERHQTLLRAAFVPEGGVEVATEGDSFFVVFRSAPSAVVAAAGALRALATEAWPPAAGTVRVRIGLHTGEGTHGGDNYAGLDVHRAARIAAAAHGGQVLMSDATRALVAGSLPADLGLRDLGDFRLKDLERPEHLVQLVVSGLPDEFPAPRTLEIPSNLPAQLTSFIGRERETAEVIGLVRQARLVTLTGPGGSGKTRLGLHVAARLRGEFPDGAHFVDLAPIRDANLVPPTIASALGVREEPARPVVGSLEAYLRGRRLLLVIDNFEQVLDAAPLAGRLLQAAPDLTILVTSREVLHVRGEQEYPVPALALPDLRELPPVEALAQFEAVELFAQRARAARPDFVVTRENAGAVAAICVRLDGLPLAIELAAARVKLLAPEAILARLEKRLGILTSAARDLPPRQRTLRGAIDWSYELLDPVERSVFCRLAVFVNGCTIESAQAVCDPEQELGIDMLDPLAALVDKSLLREVRTQRGESRFGMLETIREYALERLDASGDARLARRRHADHYAALAQHAEAELLGPHPNEWLDRLDGDRDNLRAAIGNAADDGRIEPALALGGALWRFWQQRGHLAEGRTVLDDLLGRPEAAPRTSARARALTGLGGLAYWQGDFAAAGLAYREALDIARGRDDTAGLAEGLYNAGFVAAVIGDYDRAREDYEESLRLHAEIRDPAAMARVREALVFLMFREGDFAGAQRLQEENLRAFRERGEPFRIANGLNLWSAIQLKLGLFEAARASQAEALEIFRGTGDPQGMVRVLVLAAAVAIGDGRPERAAQLSGAADALKEPLGVVATPVDILRLDDPAQAALGQLGREAFDRAYALGRQAGRDEMAALVGGP